MNPILACAKEWEEQAIALRRTLHKTPELGFELPNTIATVTQELKSYGYEPKQVGKAGLTACVGPDNGKTILLRADMDALPLQEQTDLPFQSCNENMHACGHDFHTSALLTAARILKEKEHMLKGQVKLMFQPCEEGMQGAQDMLNAEILKNPEVDAALALHVVHRESGMACYSPGLACGSSDVFTITVTGKGCHGAAPNLGVDPINVAMHIHQALQGINSREVHPDQMVVCTVCQIHAGTASNIFPEKAVMQGTIRTMDNEVRLFVKDRVRSLAREIAKAFRAEATVEYVNDGVPPMVNDGGLLNDTNRYIDELLGEGTTQRIPRMTGSEDFSVISQKVPSVLYWIGAGSEEEGYLYGVHDARVVFNEGVLHKMAAIYAYTAIRWLEEHA